MLAEQWFKKVLTGKQCTFIKNYRLSFERRIDSAPKKLAQARMLINDLNVNSVGLAKCEYRSVRNKIGNK